jgi:hypothetical protein
MCTSQNWSRRSWFPVTRFESVCINILGIANAVIAEGMHGSKFYQGVEDVPFSLVALVHVVWR